MKLSKQQKSLLISLILGDGTICSNYVLKLSHSEQQKEFLEWKLKIIREHNLKISNIKRYISKCGYNTGKSVIYAQMSVIPTIKALRRSVYTPKKTINRKLLNWLDPIGIAIWYMDDGMNYINTSKQRSSNQYKVKISTCLSNKDDAIIITKYFDEEWNIKFICFNEKGKWSIETKSKEDYLKFINIVSPYIKQIPSMWYKIRKDYNKETFEKLRKSSKCETLLW